MNLEQAISEIRMIAEPSVLPWNKRCLVSLEDVLDILVKVEKECTDGKNKQR